MQTIALVTQKGGSGKSTLAIGLALAAIEDGHRVRLIDTDPQETLVNWRRRRRDPEPLVDAAASSGQLERKLWEFADDGITLTIIDTASGERTLTRAAMRVADLCVIPARPSPADLESAVHTLRAIRQLGKPFCFVLNQTPVRSQEAGDVTTALSVTAWSLSIAGVLALPYIGQRDDQLHALAAGLAVTEYAPQGQSADEVRKLWQWMADKLPARAGYTEQPALRLVG